jgi:5-methylcytosine-specific restriction endonuclease McrA
MSRHTPKGQRWMALRALVLSRDGHRCRRCGARGQLEVDHIEPVSRGGRAFDPGNLQALCIPCHVAKTNSEMGRPALSEDRREWREAVLALSRGGRTYRADRKEVRCSTV